jgi:antitoxin VapB
MAFHIRNSETDRLAREVARLKRIGLTEAVHAALERELAHEQAQPSSVDIALEFVRRFRSGRDPSHGLPADKAFYDSLSGDD